MTRCARCGVTDNCLLFTIQKIAVCEGCLALIVAEWNVRLQEFGELAAS